MFELVKTSLLKYQAKFPNHGIGLISKERLIFVYLFRERERESNTFEVGRQNDNVFLNMIFQLEKLNKQFFYRSFTSV